MVSEGLVRNWRESLSSVGNTARFGVKRRSRRRKVRERQSDLRRGDGRLAYFRQVMIDVTATAYDFERFTNRAKKGTQN